MRERRDEREITPLYQVRLLFTLPWHAACHDEAHTELACLAEALLRCAKEGRSWEVPSFWDKGISPYQNPCAFASLRFNSLYYILFSLT